MDRQQQDLVTAMDVGSAKTCAIVSESTESGPRYLGHGVAESRGSRKGAIVDLEKAIASVQRAVEKAEATAGVPVERALVGIGGGGVSRPSHPRRGSAGGPAPASDPRTRCLR